MLSSEATTLLIVNISRFVIDFTSKSSIFALSSFGNNTVAGANSLAFPIDGNGNCTKQRQSFDTKAS